MTTLNLSLDELITRNPRLRGGRPVISGTATSVRAIAIMYKQGLTPEEITGELPLSLAQVYAALAFYHSHTAEIEADIVADSEEALKQDNPQHSGIIVSDQLEIGVVVRRLLRLINARTAQDMVNRLEFLGDWR